MPSAIAEQARTHDLALTGPGLGAISDPAAAKEAVLQARVFARVSPDQKAAIVDTYNASGFVTLMCGDGTNDVGALKRAHVGVALLAGSEAPSTSKPRSGAATGKPAKTQGGRAAPLRRGRKAQAPQQPRKQDDPWAELSLVDVPKMGDASMAAPFTAKTSSVLSVCQIVRQGRATLATTLQMLQILALNCLINAYTQSVL